MHIDFQFKREMQIQPQWVFGSFAHQGVQESHSDEQL